MNTIKKYKELFIVGLVIIGFVFYWYDLKPNQVEKQSQNEIKNARISKPQNLKEGQCVIQVLGVKGRLFDEMESKCRVLVVLDKQGLITEIIENNK